MKLQPVAALSLASLLAACGGSSGGNAALNKTFSYASPVPPTALEQSAVSTAQSALSSAATLSTAADQGKALAVASFAETVGNIALPSGLASSQAASHAASSALRAAAVSSACTTQTASSITFTNCTDTQDSLGFTINGKISWTAAPVTWDITGAFKGTQGTTAFDVTLHQVGTLATAASKVTGSTTSDFNGSISAPGQAVSFGLATAAVIDVTYQATPTYCVTAGTLEVKRVWTQKPQGASGTAFTDAAVKVGWTGCNAFQVAHGT
jgi:hypothetical protein